MQMEFAVRTPVDFVHGRRTVKVLRTMAEEDVLARALYLERIGCQEEADNLIHSWLLERSRYPH
jgi:hypothetical protein